MVYPAIKDRPMSGDGFTCSAYKSYFKYLRHGLDHEWACFLHVAVAFGIGCWSARFYLIAYCSHFH